MVVGQVIPGRASAPCATRLLHLPQPHASGHTLDVIEHTHRGGQKRGGDATLDRAGKKRWRERVARMVRLLDRVFNVDLLHIGGGNARKLRAADLPASVRMFDNVEGMTGGVRLWQVE